MRTPRRRGTPGSLGWSCRCGLGRKAARRMAGLRIASRGLSTNLHNRKPQSPRGQAECQKTHQRSHQGISRKRETIAQPPWRRGSVTRNTNAEAMRAASPRLAEPRELHPTPDCKKLCDQIGQLRPEGFEHPHDFSGKTRCRPGDSAPDSAFSTRFATRRRCVGPPTR
jgi:hypothetical protein